MAPLCLSKNWGDGKYLFSLFWLNAMTERKVQHIAVIPLKS